MEDRAGNLYAFIPPIRWTARIWSIISIGLVVAFIVGEGFDPTKITAEEWLGFLFFPVGISVGMIIAWWREFLGGIVTESTRRIGLSARFRGTRSRQAPEPDGDLGR